ncbi:MAG TPA: 2-oxo acid dehydrogenase subunit E2 [Steroidobacteraceae bacterium]|nr:2-oxo acid dehydrogenase subunit E2 [Steroidobacteraceae bacterium]
MSATIDVLLPEDQAEGTRSQVLRWLKTVGDTVARDEPLVEIETDKVTIEVPAPADGVIEEIAAAEGADVAPGALLGRIRAEGAAATAPPPVSAPVKTAKAATVATPASTGTRISPAVRRLLAEKGLTAAEVRGTGEGGRVTIDDVLAAGRDQKPPVGQESVRRVPHTPMRRRIAEHMVESLLRTAPHVTTVFEADLSSVLAHRAEHQAAFRERGTPLTLTAYFVAACVDAIRAVPEANGRWTDEAILISDRIDIGIGTALEGRGLVVPVIRDAGALDLAGIADRLGDLVSRAREDRLTAADLRDGTFTISNHGVSGSLVAAPIVINQPQSAILGIGRLEKRAVVVSENGKDAIVVRPRCYVTLTIDHRVLDGHQANRFMEKLVWRIESWA